MVFSLFIYIIQIINKTIFMDNILLLFEIEGHVM